MRNSGPNLVPYYLYFGGMANQSKRRTFNETSTALKIRWARKGSGRMAAEEIKLNYSIKTQLGLNDLS